MEVKKKKEEDKIEKQLAVNKDDTATEVHMLIPSPLLDPVNSLEGCFSFLFSFFKSFLLLFHILICLAGDNFKRAGGRPD